MNEGALDRAIRLVLGLGAWAAVGIIGLTPWTIALAVVGLILVSTGAVGYCPSYQFLGIKTTGATAGGDAEKQDVTHGRHAA